MATILILNWRDPQSKLEGGAERFTQKYAEYWASLGHQVIWLTNHFGQSQDEEVRRKVRYIRVGPALDGSLLKYIFFYPVYLIQSMVRAKQLISHHQVDLVIDEIHGFPFFSPLFSSKKNILLVCEVAGPIWDKMFPWPINVLGRWFEKQLYKLYAKTEIWAISKNTSQNIKQLLPTAQVKIIKLGVDAPSNIATLKKLKKTDHPSAIFLARLVRMKGIESALKATAAFVQKNPTFKLYVIGKAETKYMHHLQNMVKELQITSNVEFLGFVSEKEKFRMLRKAHFLLHPSYKEGFGLTVIEAGLVGTPAIVRTGSSLDNLVIDGINGFRFKHDSQIPKYLAQSANSSKYKKIVLNAEKTAQKRTWTNILKNSITIT